MFEINVFLVTFLTLLISIALYLRHRFTYWARHGVKGPSRVQLEAVFNKMHEFYMKDKRKWGRVFGTYLFCNKWIIINEPDLIRDIMVKDFHIFPDHIPMNLGTSKIQKALFFMKGDEEWKRIRSIVTPAFTSGKLRAMMDNISELADSFVDNLKTFAENGQTVDMRKHFGAFAMDVISACAYGIKVESIKNPNNPIVVNAKKILSVDSSFSNALSIFLPPVAKFFNVEPFDINAINYFDALTNQVVKERKNSTKNNSNKKLDFIQLMINNEKNDSDLDFETNSDDELKANLLPIKDKKSNLTLNNDELTAQGILFFIAGYDTTSAGLSHAIYYLSQNKESQQKLYDELQTLAEDFTYESLNQLKYLNAVINETLRLAPPLSSIQRGCVKDYKLGNTGITIPAGSVVEIQPYAVHRDEEFFPEPDLFKPERFLEPTHHPYAFIPFGGGPRLCVGMRFALNEMRMCIAKVIKNFEFTLVDGFQIDYFRGNALFTPKEVLVTIKKR